MANSSNATAPIVVRFALVALFLAAGYPKVTGAESAAHEFERFGYPGWFLFVVGAAEVGGAALLAARRTVTLGAMALATIMIGAIITLVNVGDMRTALVPMVVLGAIAYVAWSVRAD